MNGMAPGFPARIASPQVESVEIPQRHSLKQQMKSNQRISSELSLACVSLKFVGLPICKEMCGIFFWQMVITTEQFSSSVNMNLMCCFLLYSSIYIYI